MSFIWFFSPQCENILFKVALRPIHNIKKHELGNGLHTIDRLDTTSSKGPTSLFGHLIVIMFSVHGLQMYYLNEQLTLDTQNIQKEQTGTKSTNTKGYRPSCHKSRNQRTQ